MQTSERLLDFMRHQLGGDVSRDDYIAFVYGDNDIPDPWTPEDEAELPEELQDWSRFSEGEERQLIHDFNPFHQPAGSAIGGQFASAPAGEQSAAAGGAPKIDVEATFATLKALAPKPPEAKPPVYAVEPMGKLFQVTKETEGGPIKWASPFNTKEDAEAYIAQQQAPPGEPVYTTEQREAKMMGGEWQSYWIVKKNGVHVAGAAVTLLSEKQAQEFIEREQRRDRAERDRKLLANMPAGTEAEQRAKLDFATEKAIEHDFYGSSTNSKSDFREAIRKIVSGEKSRDLTYVTSATGTNFWPRALDLAEMLGEAARKAYVQQVAKEIESGDHLYASDWKQLGLHSRYEPDFTTSENAILRAAWLRSPEERARQKKEAEAQEALEEERQKKIEKFKAEGGKLDPEVTEVGGDAWNRQTAQRLEMEYQLAKPALDKIMDSAVGQPVGGAAGALDAPESWDEMSDALQSQTESEFVEKTTEQELEYQKENYYNEGEAERDAAQELAFKHDKEPDKSDWLRDALDEHINGTYDKESGENIDSREKLGMPRIPYDIDTLMKAIRVNADDWEIGGSKAGRAMHTSVTFYDNELRQPDDLAPFDPAQLELLGKRPSAEEEGPKHLTQEMRDDLASVVRSAFIDQAESDASGMEPPEYLNDSAKESAEEMWSEMSDGQKYSWAEDQEILDKEGVEGGDTIEYVPGSKIDPLNNTSGSDYRETQKIARHLSITRAVELIGKVKPGIEARTVGDVDGQLWSAWKDSSTSDEGKLLQVATADELGGRLNTGHGGIDRDESIEWANDHMDEIGGYEGVKAYIRAKWEATQWLLDRSQDKTLKLYRGLAMGNLVREAQTRRIASVEPTIGDLYVLRVPGREPVYMKTEAEAQAEADRYNAGFMQAGKPAIETISGDYRRIVNADIKRNGCASTSSDPGVSNGWDGGSDRVVVRAEVPRTAVISVPAYGINIHSEHEVVVAGTAWHNWDAWAGRAPEFEDVPMEKLKKGFKDAAPPERDEHRPFEIDILKSELDNKLPYWLDPRQRYKHKVREIVQKHRERWLASRHGSVTKQK